MPGNGKLPLSTDLSPLCGQKLIAFTVGEHHVELRFSECHVVIEGAVELRAAGHAPRSFPPSELRNIASTMAGLLGSCVDRAGWESDRGLALGFDRGVTMLALIGESGFESFSFTLPRQDGLVVV
jgi:hypothetical protein